MTNDLFDKIKKIGIDKLTELTNSDYQLLFSYKKDFEKEKANSRWLVFLNLYLEL